jgi:aspartyl-tRNA(Asn)/glutamyl-tRNA(Gln) amidotransferase subunit A
MLTRLTAAELREKLDAREISARDVAQSYLDRIADVDGQVGAFLTVSEERLFEQADRAQTKLDEGKGGPTTGIPYACKDNISTQGVRTTCASKILGDYEPPYSATVVDRLEEAGALMLGKTNLDEFAMGTSTEFSAFQVTRNPWDLERAPGGSSGGSAAAVAAELAPLALGSDTGGSIRQPAALCGVVGYKPTYGRCSRYGLVAFASSLDQIGPFARTVEDAALIAEAITGHDPLDSTCLDLPPVSRAQLKEGALKGLRIALPKELFGDGIDAGVRETVQQAIDRLAAEGAVFEEVSLPSIRVGVTTYYIIAPCEASSNLARFDGVRYGPRSAGSGHIDVVAQTRGDGFGHEVKARIMIGTYALSAGYYDAYYVRAQQARALMRREFEHAFESFDLILSPTSPVPAFKLGELRDDPMALKLLDFCTIPANMGGFPAISLNCGWTQGLPVGLQLMAPVLQDERLLQAAYQVEQVLNATGRPPIP